MLRGDLSLNRYVVMLIVDDALRRFGIAPMDVLTE
jgi:hypothetical protein